MLYPHDVPSDGSTFSLCMARTGADTGTVERLLCSGFEERTETTSRFQGYTCHVKPRRHDSVYDAAAIPFLPPTSHL